MNRAQMLPQIMHGCVLQTALQALEGIFHFMDVLTVIDQVHLLGKGSRAGLALVGPAALVRLHQMLVQGIPGLGLVVTHITLVGLLLEVDRDDVVLQVGLLLEGGAADVADKGALSLVDLIDVLLHVILGLSSVRALIAGVGSVGLDV